MAVADDSSDTGERCQFLGGALGVAAGGNDPCSGIETVGTADEGASLAVSLGGDAAGIHDNHICFRRVAFGCSSRAQGGGYGFAIGAGGATAEILDVEG